MTAGDRHRRHRPVRRLADGDRRAALAPLIFLGKLRAHPCVGVALAFVVPVLVAGALGWFNGWLVTRFRIQPIIATLVLFIAGRGIAQVLTDGNLQVFNLPSSSSSAWAASPASRSRSS